MVDKRCGTSCTRCQGNGEIITDWNRFMDPHPEDQGDEAVVECPDCDGTAVSGTTCPAWLAIGEAGR